MSLSHYQTRQTPVHLQLPQYATTQSQSQSQQQSHSQSRQPQHQYSAHSTHQLDRPTSHLTSQLTLTQLLDSLVRIHTQRNSDRQTLELFPKQASEWIPADAVINSADSTLATSPLTHRSATAHPPFARSVTEETYLQIAVYREQFRVVREQLLLQQLYSQPARRNRTSTLAALRFSTHSILFPTHNHPEQLSLEAITEFLSAPVSYTKLASAELRAALELLSAQIQFRVALQALSQPLYTTAHAQASQTQHSHKHPTRPFGRHIYLSLLQHTEHNRSSFWAQYHATVNKAQRLEQERKGSYHSQSLQSISTPHPVQLQYDALLHTVRCNYAANMIQHCIKRYLLRRQGRVKREQMAALQQLHARQQEQKQ